MTTKVLCGVGGERGGKSRGVTIRNDHLQSFSVAPHIVVMIKRITVMGYKSYWLTGSKGPRVCQSEDMVSA